MYNLPGYDNLLRSLDPGAGTPGGSGGTPAFSDGSTATGTGNMTGGQAAAAFGQGAVQGLPGVALGQNVANSINNGNITAAQAAQMGLQGVQFAGQLATGVNPVSMLGNMGIRGLISLAKGAQASTGFRGPQTFNEALKEFTQNFNNLFGFKTPEPPPLPFYDPFAPKNTDDEPDPNDAIPDSAFPDAPTVSYPDVNLDANPDGSTPGPTGSVGVSDTGGNPSGDPSDFFRGGPVHGPAGRDRVPAHLTSGEYVIDADSARHFRTVIDQINRWHP